MDNALKHIYSLEGAAFAGKTTLLNYLKTEHGHSFSVVQETSEYVGGDKNLPDIPFKDFEAAKANVHYFIELEKIRCQDALRLYRKYGRPVIMDRSTPISSPVFYHLLEEKHPDWHTFKESFFQYALEAFAKEIKLGNIFIPAGLIYLHPKNKKVFVDRLPRGTKNMVFAQWDSYKFLNSAYRKLTTGPFKNKVLTISSENTEKSLKDNTLKISRFVLRGLPDNYDSGYLILNNFLDKNARLDTGIDILTEESKYRSAAKHVRDLVKDAEINCHLIHGI